MHGRESQSLMIGISYFHRIGGESARQEKLRPELQ
jgi:hypothetical protein